MADIPFIKLFHTPNSAYFLDVNKNEILPVSEDSFQYLRAILSNGSNGGSIPKELIELKDLGYLTTESNVKEIRHPYTDFLDLFLERKVKKITLQLTQNCNFRCKYCVYTEKPNSLQRTHSANRMSWKTAKEAVDFLWSHSVDSPDVNIGLYGGEPLLEFKLIKKIVKYSKKLYFGKNLSFNITTNGTLLTSEIINFLKMNDVSLMISLDGPKEINDKNRVFKNGLGTYDAVMKNLQLVKMVAPEYAKRISISMVMDPKYDFDCMNNIYIEGADLDELYVQSTLIDHGFDDQKNIFSEEYNWKYEYHHFLAILSIVNRFPKSLVSPIIKSSVNSNLNDHDFIENSASIQNVDTPSGPCIPGQMRLFVDTSGKFFPCERVSEISSAMNIGSIQKGFELDKAKQILNVGQLTEKECRQCWCFRYCVQCAKKADNEAGELSAKTRLSHCLETKLIAYSKMKQYLLFKEMAVYYSKQIKVQDERGVFL